MPRRTTPGIHQTLVSQSSFDRVESLRYPYIGNSTWSLFSCVIEPSESTLLFRVDCCTILFFFFCFLADKNKNLEQFLKFDRADIELRHGTKRLGLDLVRLVGSLVVAAFVWLLFPLPSSLFSFFLSFVRASLRREENDLGITGTGWIAVFK